MILKETPGAKLLKVIMDLASLESVRKAAAEVNTLELPIDVRRHSVLFSIYLA